MARLLLLLGLAAGLFLFFQWLFRQPPRVRWQWLAVLLALGLLVLVANFYRTKQVYPHDAEPRFGRHQW
jgi:hypothetical protein